MSFGGPNFWGIGIIRSFVQKGRPIDDINAETRLDREELREAEYELMGMPAPPQQGSVERPKRHRFLGLFGRR